MNNAYTVPEQKKKDIIKNKFHGLICYTSINHAKTNRIFPPICFFRLLGQIALIYMCILYVWVNKLLTTQEYLINIFGPVERASNYLEINELSNK